MPAEAPTAVPAAPAAGAAPAALSLWGEAVRHWPVRIGLVLAGLAFLAGIYGPFLAGETALLWRDGSGAWSAPVLADLFNARNYPKVHELAFNLLALLLPLFVLARLGWRRGTLARHVLVCIGVLTLATAACWAPLVPGDHGWRSLWRDRPLTAQVVTQAADATWAVFPPIPFRADATVSGQVLKGPGSVDQASGRRFWLGTDSAGKDVAAQMVMGARISLTVGLVAMGLSLGIGILVGACSGFFGGWVDLLLQRVVEIMMCFPTFILILVVVAMTSRDIFIIMTVIGLTSWADTARLVRGEFLAQSVRDYVLAGRALGLGRLRLMFGHILPNALTPILITATFGFAGAVGSESALSFIGLGDPTVASWGSLLEQGQQNIQYGWLIWTPGLAVFGLVYALNLVGEGFRKALDVQAR